MSVACKLDARFVDGPTGAVGLEIVNRDFGVGNIDYVAACADVGGDIARAIDLPCAERDEWFGAGEPVGDGARRMYGDWEDGVFPSDRDGTCKSRIELIALTRDLKLGGIDSSW